MLETTPQWKCWKCQLSKDYTMWDMYACHTVPLPQIKDLECLTDKTHLYTVLKEIIVPSNYDSRMFFCFKTSTKRDKEKNHIYSRHVVKTLKQEPQEINSLFFSLGCSTIDKKKHEDMNVAHGALAQSPNATRKSRWFCILLSKCSCLIEKAFTIQWLMGTIWYKIFSQSPTQISRKLA